MQDLGTLGGSQSIAEAINEYDQVVGVAAIPNGSQHAFLYSNGVCKTWEHSEGTSDSHAYSINNLGQIVGDTSGQSSDHPFLFASGTMYDLQSLVSGVTILHAYSINDLGQIAGDGSFNGEPTHAILLTPMTHPAFFTGETALGGGWYYLQFPNGTPFGYYSYLPDQHFIYHIDLGFEYLFDANDANHGIYFYDFASSSFFYTSPTLFPDLYDFSLNAWLYYLPDANNPGRYSHNPRWFFNFATGQWITL